MNITLSVEDDVVEAARHVAAQRGTSLNELVRGYLRSLVGRDSGATAGEELLALMQEAGGHSYGQRFDRADVYEGRA